MEMEVDGEKLRGEDRRESKKLRREDTRESKRARLGELKFLVRQRAYTEHFQRFSEELRNAPDIRAETKIREREMDNPQPGQEDAWCLVTWNDENKEFTLSKLDAIFGYPDEIHQFNKSGVHLHDSKLFYVSGYHRGTYRASVWALDFKKLLEDGQPEWRKCPDVKTPRTLPAVVGVGDYLYVFGKFLGHDPEIYLTAFGERIYIGEDDQHGGPACEYLPPPPKFLQQEKMLLLPTAYAVYYNTPSFFYTSAEDDTTHHVPADQNLILLPAMLSTDDDHPVICVFNCSTTRWLPSIKLNFTGANVSRFDPWPAHSPLVVVDGVFIWHLRGSISGYDLPNQKYLGPLFRIPPVQLFPYKYKVGGLYAMNDPAMFFVRRGDDALFLFFQDNHSCHTIHCHKFRILKANQDQAFGLRHEKYTHLSTEPLNSFRLLNVQAL